MQPKKDAGGSEIQLLQTGGWLTEMVRGLFHPREAIALRGWRLSRMYLEKNMLRQMAVMDMLVPAWMSRLIEKPKELQRFIRQNNCP
jgi:hypothetical protein